MFIIQAAVTIVTAGLAINIFGTFDLSKEIGKPGDITNPELVNLIKTCNDFLISKKKIIYN